MNKLYAVFILFISILILIKFLPGNINNIKYKNTEIVYVNKRTGNEEVAILAGGCFWCMEHPFEDIPGVLQSISGYTGGKKKNPTYEQVASGQTQHLEAVEIHFNPEKISYSDILEIFWRNINPTDNRGQFVDRGPQYRTGIFYTNKKQKELAEKSKENLTKNGRFKKAIVTPVVKASAFYQAEKYHQDFFKKKLYPL